MHGATKEGTGGTAGRHAWRPSDLGGTGRAGTHGRRLWPDPNEFARRRSLGYSLPAGVAAQRQTAVLATALLRIGVNLNQLTHQANAGREPEPDVLRTLADRITALLDGFYGPETDRPGSKL